MKEAHAPTLPGLGERRLRALVKQLVRQRRIVAPCFRILARYLLHPPGAGQKAYPVAPISDAELVEILHRPSNGSGSGESSGIIQSFR